MHPRRSTVPALALTLAVVACGSSTTSTSSTTKPAPSTTTGASTEQPSSAVWPLAASPIRYTDPVKAATGFATTYLNFVNPVVGRFRAGDRRSGEVVVRPTSSGPQTTVIVRRLAPDDSWWVLGASTPNLQVQSPSAGASITSPVTLSGTSTAFEGTVSVEIRADGSTAPIATDFVTGGANGTFGPFSKSIPFDTPTGRGAIILKTFGTENNVLWETSVVRVQFS